jgi:glycosyltransferase involved in cell wall biosynthesis
VSGSAVSAPRLSIGLPVYNGERYLAEAVDSLLTQSFDDFELIISDNASTDRTSDICRRYAQQDSRIHYYRQPQNIGLAPNHNFVVEQARGEYFKWAASDDLYGHDLLLRCVAALDRQPEVVLADSWTAAVDGAGKVTQAYGYPLATDRPTAPERFRSFLFGNSGMFEAGEDDGRRLTRFDNQGILRADDQYGVIRTDVLRKVAPLGSYHHADRILMAEILLHGPFHETPEWLYFRREHEERAYRAGLGNGRSAIQNRAVIHDPGRASRFRHPTIRLVVEYLMGYVWAIRRAPLSHAERRACYRELVAWMADRALNSVVPRPLESLDRYPSVANINHADSVRFVASGHDQG